MRKTKKTTFEFLRIWKGFQNHNFNYGELAVIKSFKPLEFEGIRKIAGFSSIGKQLNKPDFNSVKFDGIKMLAGLNSYQMQVLTTAPALKQIKE